MDQVRAVDAEVARAVDDDADVVGVVRRRGFVEHAAADDLVVGACAETNHWARCRLLQKF